MMWAVSQRFPRWWNVAALRCDAQCDARCGCVYIGVFSPLLLRKAAALTVVIVIV